jgi:hypothetical protein
VIHVRIRPEAIITTMNTYGRPNGKSRPARSNERTHARSGQRCGDGRRQWRSYTVLVWHGLQERKNIAATVDRSTSTVQLVSLFGLVLRSNFILFA